MLPHPGCGREGLRNVTFDFQPGHADPVFIRVPGIMRKRNHVVRVLPARAHVVSLEEDLADIHLAATAATALAAKIAEPALRTWNTCATFFKLSSAFAFRHSRP